MGDSHVNVDCNVVKLQSEAGRSTGEIASALGVSEADVQSCHAPGPEAVEQGGGAGGPPPREASEYGPPAGGGGGARVRVLRNPRLELDIDELEDLRRLANQLRRESATARWLVERDLSAQAQGVLGRSAKPPSHL